MRLMQFRAFNKELKLMTLPFTMADLYDPSVYQYDFTNGEYCCTDDMGYDELIFMQFTGLYDRKKVPIFEGDILKYQRSPNYIVEFSDGRFTMACKTKDGEAEMWLNKETCHIMQVIGNIFESDLLKKNKGGKNEKDSNR